MGIKRNSRPVRTALLGLTTAAVTATALTVTAPVPTPPALLAQEQHAVDLTAASTPYQQLQDGINTVLPALVNTFGAQPTITLDTLLAQVPPGLLTELLNANGGTINLTTLLGTLGLNTPGSSLNAAVTEAISSALTDYLTSATTGPGAAALEAQLRSTIASAVRGRLNGLSITVLNQNVSLATIIGSSGINNLANSVAGTVSDSIMNNLNDILPTGDELSAEITAVLPDLLTTVFNSADLTDADGNFKLGNLLDLVGLNLGTLADSGALTVTSAGPLFTLARMLAGVDLGWVPGTESAIANSINNTAYLELGTSTLKTNLAAALADALADGSLAGDLGTTLTPTLNNIVNQIVDNATSTLEDDLTDSLNDAVSGLNYTVDLGPWFPPVTVPVGDLLQDAIAPLIGNLAGSLNDNVSGSVAGLVDDLVATGTGSISDALSDAVTGAIDAIPDQDVASVRVPIVLGTGLGAFSAGAAYRDVLAQLSSQPGGVDYIGNSSLLGSLTILPAILLNNAGRANGGIMARFADLFAMLGIDAVTPDVAISSSGGTAVGDTGLALGGANLLPVKIDATVQYQLMSDFAAWANPLTLLNNVAAGALPTYMLRGLDLTGAAGQLTTELEELVGSITDQEPADTNIYLTVAARTLPLLEPLYLIGDVMQLMGLTPVGNVFSGLANALSPALTSLVNLGYSDAYWNAETGAYERTLDTAATPVQFGTLPNINWGQVLPNVLKQFATGFQTALTTDNSVPNALSGVGDLLNGDIGDVLSGLTGATDESAGDSTTDTLSGDTSTTPDAEGFSANRSGTGAALSADSTPQPTDPPAGQAVESPAEEPEEPAEEPAEPAEEQSIDEPEEAPAEALTQAQKMAEKKAAERAAAKEAAAEAAAAAAKKAAETAAGPSTGAATGPSAGAEEAPTEQTGSGVENGSVDGGSNEGSGGQNAA